MKKIITMLMCVALLLSSCSSLCACSSYDSENAVNDSENAVKNSENPIEFGKKYMVGKNNYYIFNHDGTGTFYRKYVYEYEPDSKYNYTLSGSVDFVWREASDGAIYLFEREVHYNEDHTEGKRLRLKQQYLLVS